MVESKFEQKRLFRKQEFELRESELRIKRTVMGQITEWSIPFEDLGNRTIIKRGSKLPIYFFGIIATFLLGLIITFLIQDRPIDQGFIISLIIFGCITLLTYIGRDRFIYLVGGNSNIELYLDAPSEIAVTNFINHIMTSINQYLKNKYCVIDFDLPIEPQLSRVIWLKERKVISELEFQTIKESVKKKTDLGSSSIGFSIGT